MGFLSDTPFQKTMSRLRWDQPSGSFIYNRTLPRPCRFHFRRLRRQPARSPGNGPTRADREGTVLAHFTVL